MMLEWLSLSAFALTDPGVRPCRVELVEFWPWQRILATNGDGVVLGARVGGTVFCPMLPGAG